MLQRAATYFLDTPLFRYQQGSWVPMGVSARLETYDRFISEREFGNRRRMLLADTRRPVPDDVFLVRVGRGGPIYMLGSRNLDLDGVGPYSQVILGHIADATGYLVSKVKKMAVSGAVGRVTETLSSLLHCSVERLTFSASREFHELRMTEYLVTLPADTAANADQEFQWAGHQLVVQEVYPVSGFLQLRTIRKKDITP